MNVDRQETYHILLIDDDEEEFLIARAMFNASRHPDDYAIDWLSTCQDGLNAICSGKYDAVLLDYNLGNENGIDLLKSARGNGCDTPIIMLTASKNPDIDLTAMQSGATDYLDRADVTPALLERALRYAISNHRMAKKAQAESAEQKRLVEVEHARLSVVIEHAPSGIILADAAGQFTIINPAAFDLFPPDSLRGDAYGPPAGCSLRHSDGTPYASADLPLPRALQGQTVSNEEIIIHHDDGKEVYTLANASPIYAPDRQITGAILILRDITEYFVTSQALLTSEARLQSILSNTPIVMFTLDTDLRYTWIYNPRHGLHPRLVLGKRDDQLLDAEAAEIVMAPKREVLQTQTGVRRELVYTINGEMVAYDASFEPIFSASGECTGISGVVMDVTDLFLLRNQQTESLTQIEIQRSILEQREQERLQIARELHDGPTQNLIAIAFSLENLREDIKGEPELAEAVMDIRQQVQQQIAELRSFAAELRPPTLVSFGVRRAIATHLAEFRQKHPKLQISFESVREKDTLPDDLRVALYRIYQEVLNNVVKHAQASTVRIDFKTTRGEAILEIQDNGIGFNVPKDWLQLARKKHLGLVGIQERARAVHGTVTIESRAGSGTTVRVRVPIPGKGVVVYNSP